MIETSWLKQNEGIFCNLDLTTEEMGDVNIDDYQKNDFNNIQIVYQNLDQSRRNNNQNNNDDDIPSLEDKEVYDDEIGIGGW